MHTLQSKRDVQTGIMRLDAPPRQVFPLLCPRREYDWIPLWKCRMIFSESGAAENNAVFYTDFRQDRGPEWWIVSRYDPWRAIEFIRFSPGVRISRLDIHLAPDGPEHTIATWTQTLTALSPEGNAFIDGYGDGAYRREIETLETLLNHYLTTGNRLGMPHHGMAQGISPD